MAQEIVQYRVCDLCEVDVPAAVTDRVTLNGYAYDLDLCTEHSAELYGVVMRFADHGALVREPTPLDKPKVYAPVAPPLPRREQPVEQSEDLLPLSALDWTLSVHAEQRMVERGFTKTDVLWTCAEPEVVLPPLYDSSPCEQRKRGRCLVVVDPQAHRVVTVKVAGETRHSWSKKESA